MYENVRTGVCGWLANKLYCKSGTPGCNRVDHFSVPLSQYLCRLVSDCIIAFVYTEHTEIIAHIKIHVHPS